MKAAHLYVPAEGLKMNVADATDRAAAARFESVQQSLAFLLLLQLLLDIDEYSRVDPLNLKFTVPGDCVLQRGPFAMQ